MKLVVARSALHDLQSIKDHHAEPGVPEIGQELVRIILQKVQRLTDHSPDSGGQVPEFAQTQIREIIHLPFRVVYLRHKSAINLVRVWRGERVLVLPEGGI